MHRTWHRAIVAGWIVLAFTVYVLGVEMAYAYASGRWNQRCSDAQIASGANCVDDVVQDVLYAGLWPVTVPVHVVGIGVGWTFHLIIGGPSKLILPLRDRLWRFGATQRHRGA